MASPRGLLLLAVALGSFSAINAQCADACWEKCYQQAGLTEIGRYREVYDDILEIALEINFLRNLYNISRIGWLIDSSISDRRNVPENTFTDELENGVNIYRYQILLAMALSLTVNGQYNYLVQYDEGQSWTCNELSCLSSGCATAAALNRLSNVEMLPTSHCPGNVESACKLLNNQVVNVGSCPAPNPNTMAIAITNSDFYISDGRRRSFDSRPDDICPHYHWGGLNSDSSSSSSSSEESFFSPCHSYFETRYVVGTNSPRREVMELFPSYHGNYRYIHDEKFSYNALATLVTCMLGSTACCTTAPAATTVTTCYVTQGPFGEIINNYPTHSAFTAANNIFGATVPAAITTI